MKRTNADYFAEIVLGLITIDDVPEARQRWVQWALDQAFPNGIPDDPLDRVVAIWQRADRSSRRAQQLEQR